MSPFKGPTWKEADRKATEELRRAEQLKVQMKEHDYLECYCYALKNPPWGGYSIEEQILHEIKQRKKSVDGAEPQDTRSSRYSYRYANNALTGEIFIHEPIVADLSNTSNTKLVCKHVYPIMTDLHRAKRENFNELRNQALDSATNMLENVSISNPTKACTGLVNSILKLVESILKQHRITKLEELPDEILYQIISDLDPYDLENVSEASRHLTILIGLVPCRDAFKWAVHRCQTYGHTRHASLCGDCVLAFENRIE